MKTGKSAAVLRQSERIYRSLLRLHPRAFRLEFGEQIAMVFRDCSEALLAREGIFGLAIWWGCAFGDLIATSIREHADQLSIAMNLRGRAPLDCLRPTSPLTSRARKSLEIAFREAAGSPNLRPEHLVLGLIEEGRGVAAKVLRDLAENPNSIRKLDSEISGRLAPAGNEAEFAADIIHWAQSEACKFGHSFIGTEHLLLGLIMECNAAVAPLFRAMGIPAAEVEPSIVRIVQGLAQSK